jgi:hypothetical protein
MDGSDFTFEYKQRVRLKDQDFSSFEAYQGQSTAGCPGWVTQRQRDSLGLPQIYIEWDHEDWRYNGVPNCWTYQEHFEIAEEVMTEPTRTEMIQGAVQAFTDMILDLTEEASSESAAAPVAPLERAPAALTPKEQVLISATQLLSTSEAFVLIGVSPTKEAVVIPYSDNVEAAMIVSTHMSKLAAKAHEALTLRTLKANHDVR